MAEEATQAPADTQDTPTHDSAPQVEDTRADAPDEGADEHQPDVDWEKRYNDLRPEYDRGQAALKEAQQAQQVIAALRSDDPNERAWAAEVLGLELEEEADDDTPDDDDGDEEFRDPRLDGFLEREQQREHEAHLDRIDKYVDTTIEALNEKHKTDLDDSEKFLIFKSALALAPREDGMPDIEKAFEEFTGILDTRIKKYRESKKNAPSPPVQGGGSGSTPVQTGDRKARLQHAMQVADRAFRSQ